MQLLKELPQPAALGHHMGHSMVLHLSTRAGHYSLALGRSGHQIVTEKDVEAEGGAACVGVACPVSVRVDGELANGERPGLLIQCRKVERFGGESPHTR
jgi:hypothetical protein